MPACSGWDAEIVECVRGDCQPAPPLRAHLAVCEACAARFEAEQELTARFREIRAVLPPPRALGGAGLVLAEYDRTQQRPGRRGGLAWVFAIAAMLLVSFFVGQPWRTPGDQALLSASEAAEPSDAMLDPSDFVAVPFVPPLATGEAVRVVRMELPAGALVRMGFGGEAEIGETITAEVLVGEDDLPRAVLLPESNEFWN